jgi:hypothetical protein
MEARQDHPKVLVPEPCLLLTSVSPSSHRAIEGRPSVHYHPTRTKSSPPFPDADLWITPEIGHLQDIGRKVRNLIRFLVWSRKQNPLPATILGLLAI